MNNNPKNKTTQSNTERVKAPESKRVSPLQKPQSNLPQRKASPSVNNRNTVVPRKRTVPAKRPVKRSEIQPKQKVITEPLSKRLHLFFKKLIRYTCIFIVFYVLMLSAFCGSIYLSVKSSSDDSEVIKYNAVVEITPATTNTKAVTITYDSETIYHNGVMYLPIDILKNYTEIVEIGDYESRTFIIGDDKDELRCYIDTTNVSINGTRSFLKDDVLLINGRIWLSLNFYTNVMTGIKSELKEDIESYYISPDSELKIGLKIKGAETNGSVPCPEAIQGASD